MHEKRTPIFLLPGMSPNLGLFDRLLPLLPGAAVVPWIEPQREESIRQYAERLAEKLPTKDDCLVCGVSFGGIVARELAHVVSARGCILVSSVRSPAELPPWFRVMRYSPARSQRVLAAVGTLAASMPRRIRSRSTVRLTKLAGSGGAWHRWATAAVLRWRTRPELDEIPSWHIHGDCDTTLPLRYVHADVIIRGGGHVLPLTHPEELAEVITRQVTTWSLPAHFPGGELT